MDYLQAIKYLHLAAKAEYTDAAAQGAELTSPVLGEPK